MPSYDYTPAGLRLQIMESGVLVDRTAWTSRKSAMTITRPKPGQNGTMTVGLWDVGGALQVKDWAFVCVDDPTGSLYPRYFSGYARPQYHLDDNLNLGYTLDCVDLNWVWKNPPAMPTAKIRVGAAPVWVPTHPYSAADAVQPFPSNGHQYTANAAGLSGPGPVTWPTGAGATVVDGTITWTEAGSSLVSDVTAINAILDLYYPAALFPHTRTALNSLVASIPSIEIQEGWTADDAMQAVANTAVSTTYYALYPAWQASHVYTVGTQIEPTTPNGFVYQVQSVTSDAKSGAGPPTFLTTVGSTFVDNHVTWLVASRLGRWESSVPMIIGQRIEPDGPHRNGYYYDVIVAGTTNVLAPAWGTPTLGGTVVSGGVTFLCMGTTTVIPVWQWLIPPDSAGHTANWNPVASWRNANSIGSDGITLNTVAYSDQTSEDSTHVHYSNLTLNRDGNSYRNAWYVWGKNGAFAYVPNPTAITADGITIAGTYIDTSDTGPSTFEQCYEKGTVLLASSIMKSSLQIKSPMPVDPIQIQSISLGRVESSLLGTDPAFKWPFQNIAVNLSETGTQWDITAGSDFGLASDDPYAVVPGGPQYVQDTTPPALVTYPIDWVLENIADLPNSAHLHIKWKSGGEADLNYFRVWARVVGENADREIGQVFWPTQDVQVPNLPPNTSVTFYISSHDTRGNVQRNPDGTLKRAVSPAVTTATYSAPIAPTLGTITDLPSPNGGYAINVPVNHAALANNLGGWVKCTGNGVDTLVAIPAGAPWPSAANIVVTGLAGGIVYQVSAQVEDQNQSFSLFCTPVNHTCGVTPPITNLPPSGFGGQNPTDGSTIAGWKPVAPSTIADYAADSSTASDIGQVALKMIMPATGSITKEIEGPDIEVRAGQYWAAGATFLGDAGLRPPSASMYLRYYNQDRSAQVSTDVQIIAPTSTTTAYSTFAKVQAAVVPAGAKRMCVVLRGLTSSGLPPVHNIWWSFPYLNMVQEAADLAPNSVTSTAIAAGAVVAGDIAVGGISAANQHAAGVVDSSALGSGAVTAGKIAVGGVPIARIGAGNITSNELGAGSVIAGKIAVGGVSASNQLAAGVVNSAALGSGAVTAGKIAVGGVLPGNTNNGVPYLENPSLEIPNIAGTMAAAWDYNNSGTVVYNVGTSIDGTCSITIGGGVGTHRLQGPKVPWAINKLVGVDLSFWYNLSTLTGTAVTFGMACYDRTGAYLTDTPCVVPGGGSFTWAAAANTLQRGFKSQSTFPGGTTYIAPYFQLVVSSGTGTVLIDLIRMDEAGGVIYAKTWAGSQATGSGDTGPSIDMSSTTVNALSTVGVKLGTTSSTPVLQVLSTTAVLNFASTAANSSSTLTVTLTGAALGDCVLLGVPNGATLGNSAYSAWVSATNTITVQFLNNSAGALDPASATFRVAVVQF